MGGKRGKIEKGIFVVKPLLGKTRTIDGHIYHYCYSSRNKSTAERYANNTRDFEGQLARVIKSTFRKRKIYHIYAT